MNLEILYFRLYMCIKDGPDVKFDSTFILEYTAKLFLAYCLWLIIKKALIMKAVIHTRVSPITKHQNIER